MQKWGFGTGRERKDIGFRCRKWQGGMRVLRKELVSK